MRRISDDERERFRRDGYLVIPDVVPPALVGRALRAINHWMATGHDFHDRETYDSRTSAEPLVADPVIVDLAAATGAIELADDLVGRPVQRPRSAQIALRYPAAPGIDPGSAAPHIDGLPTPSNGVPIDGRVHSFTLLAGILLSDTPEPGHGNFTVWPGSHVGVAEWFATNGTHVVDPEAIFEAHRELAAGVDPVAVTGTAGDLILSHYLLLHGSGGHAGPHIRYAVFFRLAVDYDNDSRDLCLVDPWREWPAMRR